MSSSKKDQFPFFNSTTKALEEANLIALGIPWDTSSTYRMGSAKAPTEIRQATTGSLYNYYTEANVNIKDKWQIFDAGDVEILTNKAKDTQKAVLNTLKRIYQKDKHHRILFLGGDHLITYFSFSSLSEIGSFQDNKVGIVYLDAHPDLYPHYNGKKFSHACVLQRIIDQTEIDPKKIIQVGIRASTNDQKEFAEKIGINTININEFNRKGPIAISESIKRSFNRTIDHVYLSIDLDVLDPAYAPGVGNPEPGGMTTRDVIDLIQNLSVLPILAFDIVELNPDFDQSNITAFAAAKMIKEILGIMNQY